MQNRNPNIVLTSKTAAVIADSSTLQIKLSLLSLDIFNLLIIVILSLLSVILVG